MKKLRKKILVTLGIGGVVLALLMFLLYLFLPEILERYIIPHFAPEAGIKKITVTIDRADTCGVELSSMRVFDGKKSGVELDKCTVDLEGISVKSIEIDGVKFFADLQNGELSIPGIVLPKGGSTTQNSSASFAIPEFLSQNFSLSIINSELNLLVKEAEKSGSVKVPLSLTIKRSGNQLNFTISTTDTVIKYDDIAIDIPKFALSGTIIIEEKGLIVSGIAKIANIDIKKAKIKIEGISGHIPFAFKFTKNGIKLTLPDKKNLIGFCKLAKFAIKGQSFNDLSFKTIQSAEKLALMGSYSKIFDDRPIKFTVYITPPYKGECLSVELLTDFNEKDLDIDFSTMPHFKSTARFTGDIDFHAEVKYKNRQLNASSRVIISNGNIEDKKKKLLIENIIFDYELEDILSLKSKPSQKLTFKKCTMQNFVIENGNFSFQSESSDSFLIEKSQFRWCNGTVAANSFRITPSHPEDIDIILYCDRLKVAELLNQFRIGDASGDGRVSGKIPIVYNQKKLNIDNGFLYSTPGVGGNIALTDFMGPLAQMAGVMQLEIAKEALQDFNYKWLRIILNSERKELLLQLEMNGAPAKPLPFGFDLTRGGLYKSNEPGTIAKFLGISFQINFRLPANRVLEYGSKFQELQKKFK